jgi:hypothetical protein
MDITELLLHPARLSFSTSQLRRLSLTEGAALEDVRQTIPKIGPAGQ